MAEEGETRKTEVLGAKGTTRGLHPPWPVCAPHGSWKLCGHWPQCQSGEVFCFFSCVCVCVICDLYNLLCHLLGGTRKHRHPGEWGEEGAGLGETVGKKERGGTQALRVHPSCPLEQSLWGHWACGPKSELSTLGPPSPRGSLRSLAAPSALPTGCWSTPPHPCAPAPSPQDSPGAPSGVQPHPTAQAAS